MDLIGRNLLPFWGGRGRREHLKELHNLLLWPDYNVMTIKDDEMVGAMHALCMAPMRNLYITLLCKSKVMRCLRRSECRGEDIIKMDIVDCGVWLGTGIVGY